jgi:hypothetical protein
MRNSQLLVYSGSSALLTAIERQRVFLLRTMCEAKACPNCGTHVNIFDAMGLDVDDYDFANPTADTTKTCPGCGRELRDYLPLISGWFWALAVKAAPVSPFVAGQFSEVADGYFGDPHTGAGPQAFKIVGGKISRKLDPGYSYGVNHSPDGFAWGYGGSGPAQLAFALALDALGDPERAKAVYQRLKFRAIGAIPTSAAWRVERGDLTAYLEAIEAETPAKQPEQA